MKKTLLCFNLLFICIHLLHAQAYEGKIEYQKTQQPVAISEVPYQQDVVEDAIKDYMSKKGVKGSSSGGFTLYKAVKLGSKDTVTSDLYFKIERKSRKEKEATVVNLLPARANEQVTSRTSADSSNIEQAKSFLDHILPYIDAFQLNLQVIDQENTVRKVNKKQNNLADDQTDFEKKIRKLNTELDQNKIDQQKQANLIEENVNQDAAALQKAHKKMSHLLDDQADLQKKLRKTQADLDQNKKDQESSKEEVLKEQQALDALKAKQKTTAPD